MISYRSKFIIKESVFTILFFYFLSWISILLSNIKDLPIIRSIIGTLFLAVVVLFYDLVLSNYLKKNLSSIIYIIITFFYYYVIFYIMLLAFGYINLIFKLGLTLNQALKANVIDMYPNGIHYILFYLFMFLIVRYLLNELGTKTTRGINKNYFFGKPKVLLYDKRIFMFMDLISSTTFAEKLGHIKYSRFISSIYDEIDEYVLATSGNIYQYVGDEVVIVWEYKHGTKNNNCLNFFRMFEKRMNELKETFINEYSIFPQFKAAFHYGEVSITEIGGILKNEIAFHGDVVNTTARICALCAELNEKVLISEDLVKILNPDDKILHVGTFKLKGKKNELKIYKLSLPGYQ